MTLLNPHRICALFLLAHLVVGIYGSDPNDNFFLKICKSALLDTPNNAAADASSRNTYSNECFQNYSLFANQDEADHFCRKAMPFDLVKATTNHGSVICTWSPGSLCPPGYIQVYDKCYRTPNGGCDPSEKLASPSQEDHIRWLSRIILLFRSSQIEPLVVKMTKVLQRKKVNEKKYFEDGHFFDATGVKDLKWTMMTDVYRNQQLKPGDIVQSRSFRRLCVKKPIATGHRKESVPSQPMYPVAQEIKELSTGSARSAGGSIDLSQGRVFITRNEYSTKLVADGKLDNGYFHEVCESLCDNCVAASGELLTEIGNTKLLPMGRYHVPMSREGIHRLGSDNCNMESKVTERRKFYSMIKTGVSEYIPVDEQWLETDGVKYPTGHCSDQERYAVQFFQGNGVFGYVDAPPFDRKPIICYKGVVPQKPLSSGECYQNSEKKNGKCQCKEGFVDGLKNEDIQLLIRMKGYTEEGYICLPPPSCTDVEVNKFPYKGFVFLADGSGTFKNQWHLVYPFVRMFRKLIPSTVPVWLVQWSSPDDWDCRWTTHICPDKYMGILDPGWTEDEFDKMASDIFEKNQDGGTLPYLYLKDVANRFIEYKSKNNLGYDDRALVIMVSDGEALDKPDMINEATTLFKAANMRMIGAQEGKDYGFTQYHKFMDDTTDHIHIPDSTDKLNEKFAFTIMDKACSKYQEADIDAAI